MGKKIQPRIYKGTRDFLPPQMVKRNYVLNIIKTVFEKYGFEPLETPTMELWETLSGKHGEEGDHLTYRFIDRGDREVGLRYDLTVPLSRVMGMYPQIPKPFKRYQIQPVWRAEKPQKGRFREFYQCDADIIGSSSMLADAEIIAVIYEILTALKFELFTIRINSRKVLAGLVEIAGVGSEKEFNIYRAIDKLDKIGFEGVQSELKAQNIPEVSIQKLMEYLKIEGDKQDRLSQVAELLAASSVGMKGIQEIRELFQYLSFYNIPENRFTFDICLARGLDYYTGPIYETMVEKPRIGSITGGGRYDNLIGLFSGQEMPATGSSVGMERIVTVMEELDMFPAHLNTSTRVLVTAFQADLLPYSIQIATMLRSAGFNTDIYTGASKLRGQFGLANDKNIPVVIIAGPDEKKEGKANVKNMDSGEQVTVPLNELVDYIQSIFQKESLE